MEKTSSKTHKAAESEKASKLARLDMRHVESMRSIYDAIMEQFPSDFGKALSKKERAEKMLSMTTLIYGEIDFDSFGICIEKIKQIYGKPNVGASGPQGVLQGRGGLFYDLGSGIGRAVIAAAVLHNFDVCTGIEILEGLHQASALVLEAYETKGKSDLARATDTVVDMKHGDILDMEFKDWRDGDVVFANSTCFDDSLMHKIAALAVGMRKGSFFITFTKSLPIADFEVLEYELYDMSWGGATVYIHQKITEPREISPDSDDDSEAVGSVK
mmetsp:Transcript_13942/g.20854  ORF Transcript_13942/g.20854 Transcript_13942/m.20854 type:complete len:272 (+) Transcript_13942:85-900(+)